jgi:hypothetical protein
VNTKLNWIANFIWGIADARVMTAVLKDDTELFRQFMDNDSFRRWMTDTVFSVDVRR